MDEGVLGVSLDWSGNLHRHESRRTHLLLSRVDALLHWHRPDSRWNHVLLVKKQILQGVNWEECNVVLRRGKNSGCYHRQPWRRGSTCPWVFELFGENLG